MKKRLLLMVAVLFASIGMAMAQTLTVTGTVVAEKDGQPIAGAYVLVNGTTLGTITNEFGEFGIREVIDKSAGALEELDIVKEKKLVQKFLHELHFEHGLASYGEKEITNNLQIGAVDTLLLSEELKSKKLFILERLIVLIIHALV